jgi:hypothetical protein
MKILAVLHALSGGRNYWQEKSSGNHILCGSNAQIKAEAHTEAEDSREGAKQHWANRARN